MKKRIFCTLLCLAMLLTVLVPLAPTANAYTEDCGTIYLQKGLAFTKRLKDVAFNYTGSYLPRVIGQIPGMSITYSQSAAAHNIYEFTLKGTPTQAGTYQFTCALQKDTDTNNYPTVTACTYTVVVMDNNPKTLSHTAFYNQAYSYELVDRVYPYIGAEAEGLEGTGLSLQQENGKWFIKGTLEKLGTIKYTARLLYEGNAYREFVVTLKSTYPTFSSSVKAKTGESFNHVIEISTAYYAGYKSFTQTSGTLPDGVKISDSMEGLRVTGTPTTPGSYVVKFSLGFYDGTTATHTLTIKVECGQHIPEDTWYSDGETHWRFCTLCDKGIDMGSHAGGQASCSTQAKCDICGEFYGSLSEHDSYGYMKAPTDGRYTTHHDIICNECHVTLYDEEHDFGPLTERNTRYCIVCRYETEPEGEGSDHTCSGGYATCISPANCSTCGQPYGEPNPENHDLYGYPKAEADSKYHTHHDITCDLCKVIVYEEEHYFGPLTERNTRYCIVCWYETAPEGEGGDHVCSGGYATCISPANCSTCGEPYGEPNPENHDLYGYPKAETDSKYHTHHDITCDLCKVIVYEEEHYFGPLTERNTRYCIVCWYETEPVVQSIDTNIKFNHTLNLASDISANFAIAKSLLSGYDMSTAYVEFEIDTYSGNEKTGTETTQVTGVLNGSYYYFTFTGLNATMMNNEIRATFYGTKDGAYYKSNADTYSVATYAYSQMNKPEAKKSLKTLCADLLRYGATAQIYKKYRTDALANAPMTDAHKSYLSDDSAVAFDNYNRENCTIPAVMIPWVGKILILDSKVTLRYVVDLSNYTGDMEDLKLVVKYTGIDGTAKTETLTELRVYNEAKNQYYFELDSLLAAELRQELIATVYSENTPMGSDLHYSVSTYGNGKTGSLLTLIKHLMCYSDSAKAYFVG